MISIVHKIYVLSIKNDLVSWKAKINGRLERAEIDLTYSNFDKLSQAVDKVVAVEIDDMETG